MHLPYAAFPLFLFPIIIAVIIVVAGTGTDAGIITREELQDRDDALYRTIQCLIVESNTDKGVCLIGLDQYFKMDR